MWALALTASRPIVCPSANCLTFNLSPEKVAAWGSVLARVRGEGSEVKPESSLPEPVLSKALVLSKPWSENLRASTCHACWRGCQHLGAPEGWGRGSLCPSQIPSLQKPVMSVLVSDRSPKPLGAGGKFSLGKPHAGSS